ncbi:MAG: hypothetical protein U0936_27770 [Planctomycetaceae bacterium]
MSEAELHILKSRLQMGMWNKAERGDIINHPPVGYIRSLSARDGDWGFRHIDPDEQLRSVVAFDLRDVQSTRQFERCVAAGS